MLIYGDLRILMLSLVAGLFEEAAPTPLRTNVESPRYPMKGTI